jgi:hypothetical protein
VAAYVDDDVAAYVDDEMTIYVAMMTSWPHTQFRTGPKLGQLFHWLIFYSAYSAILKIQPTKICQI